jgi:hypothetical protein
MRRSCTATCPVASRAPVGKPFPVTAAGLLPAFQRTLQTEELVGTYYGSDALRGWPQFRNHQLRLLPRGNFEYDVSVCSNSGSMLYPFEGTWRIVGNRIWLIREDEDRTFPRLELEPTDAGLRLALEHALWPTVPSVRTPFYLTLKR